MTSLRRFEGEIEINHQNSPGVTVDDVIAAGADPRTMPVVGKGEKFESATISCTHCQAIVILNPLRTRERHYCSHCDHYVCDKPVCRMMASGHVPHKTMQQVFDEFEAQLRLQGAM